MSTFCHPPGGARRARSHPCSQEASSVLLSSWRVRSRGSLVKLRTPGPGPPGRRLASQGLPCGQSCCPPRVLRRLRPALGDGGWGRSGSPVAHFSRKIRPVASNRVSDHCLVDCCGFGADDCLYFRHTMKCRICCWREERCPVRVDCVEKGRQLRLMRMSDSVL